MAMNLGFFEIPGAFLWDSLAFLWSNLKKQQT